LRKQFDKATQAFTDVLGGGHLTGHPQLQALTLASGTVAQTATALESIFAGRLATPTRSPSNSSASDAGPTRCSCC
jgi:hypothetical protein